MTCLIKQSRHGIMRLKLCKDCKIAITRENAYLDRKDRIRARCKTCDKLYRKKQHSTDAFSYLDKIYSKLKYEITSGRRRLSRANMAWQITPSHLYALWHKQDGKCNLTGVPMTHKSGVGKIDTNISIDRINPKVGYKPGNVQLITYRANILKHDLNESDLLRIADSIQRTLKNKKHSS